jgi:hypothetical protein
MDASEVTSTGGVFPRTTDATGVPPSHTRSSPSPLPGHRNQHQHGRATRLLPTHRCRPSHSITSASSYHFDLDLPNPSCASFRRFVDHPPIAVSQHATRSLEDRSCDLQHYIHSVPRCLRRNPASRMFLKRWIHSRTWIRPVWSQRIRGCTRKVR